MVIVCGVLTGLNKGAFSGCTGLTSVTIGNGVSVIVWDAFYNCTGLTRIDYKGTKAQWEAIKKDVWNLNTGNYTIYCTDGEIKKS